MNQKNSIIALVTGVLFAALAFYLLYQNASELEKRTTPIPILVATGYIPAGVYLKPEMVERKKVPESFVSPSAIRETKEVEGLMTLVPLSAGEQVLANKFGEGEPTLSLSLNPGFRAYTLEVNETSGVGGMVRAGNRVDILAKIARSGQEWTAFAFQDLRVLATGQRLERMGGPKKGSEASGTENGSNYGTVTLEVTPEQAETLFFLEGRPLRLVLRAPGDEEVVALGSKTEAEVLGKLGRFTPSARHGLQIIRGGSKQGE